MISIVAFGVLCGCTTALPRFPVSLPVRGIRDSPFVEFEDVSNTALGGQTHGGSNVGIPGIAIFDCNGDGLEDIFYASQEEEYHRLFINKGNFEFSEEAQQRGFTATYGSFAVAAFDMDNDGNIDLALSWLGVNRTRNRRGLQFYYNVGNCRFEDRTSSILGSALEEYTGGGLAVADFDHDGDLDLFVSAFGSFIFELPHHRGGFSTIFTNTLNKATGEFKFEILPRRAPPIPRRIEWVCVAAWDDVDEDGWSDISFGACNDPFVVGDSSYLWRNNYAENMMPDFQDISAQAGMAGLCNEAGRGPQFPMSMSFGHLDDDGHFDLFTTNAGNPALYTMYRSVWRGGKFQSYEIVDVQGLNDDLFSWGAAFVDLDNDGKDDLVTVGTFLSLGITANPGTVYRNRVRSRRKDYRFEATQTLGLANYSSSMVAYADLDHDGFVDLAVNTVCEALVGPCSNQVPLKLYKNNGGAGSQLPNRHYLDVALKGNGVGTNRFGVGASIKVRVPSFRYRRIGRIRAGSDGGVTNSYFAHFGIFNKFTALGRTLTTPTAEVCVEWEGQEMTKECFYGIALDQRVTLIQGQGTAY